MAETSKVKQYFKECFNKKLLIKKGIIAAAALIIVLIMSLSFYFWLKDGYDGKPNAFWYINVIWNPGIGFGKLEGNYPAIYALQSAMFILLLAIFLFVTNDKITASFVALAMFGGLFNLIQRACVSGTNANCVLDYFQFGFWQSFPVFNWPDMFVVIGIFGFVISYIVLIIVQSVKENKKEKDGQH